MARFEESLDINLECCGLQLTLKGNLSLREAGAKNTTLAYECPKCYRRLAVVDEWPGPDGVVLREVDRVEQHLHALPG